MPCCANGLHSFSIRIDPQLDLSTNQRIKIVLSADLILTRDSPKMTNQVIGPKQDTVTSYLTIAAGIGAKVHIAEPSRQRTKLREPQHNRTTLVFGLTTR